jgi:hypothetical protein
MPEEFQITPKEPSVPGIYAYDVIYTPVTTLKYITVEVKLKKPLNVKLKTRFQILKEDVPKSFDR